MINITIPIISMIFPWYSHDIPMIFPKIAGIHGDLHGIFAVQVTLHPRSGGDYVQRKQPVGGVEGSDTTQLTIVVNIEKKTYGTSPFLMGISWE